MFESHVLLMAVFAAVVSIMSGFLKAERARDVLRYAAKMFTVMTAGGIILSWFLALA
jgi:hypothetical protein